MEVELGNASRVDSAIIKFQKGWHLGVLKLAILVLPTSRLAGLTDSGVATFESAVEELKKMNLAMLPFPLIVVGMDAGESTPVLNWSHTKVTDPKSFSGNNRGVVLPHVVSEYLEGVVFTEIDLPRTPEDIEYATALGKRLNTHSSSHEAKTYSTLSRLWDTLVRCLYPRFWVTVSKWQVQQAPCDAMGVPRGATLG
jgi:hypothetical protein